MAEQVGSGQDLDLRGGMLVVRSGKGRKARRIPLHPEAITVLDRYMIQLRCPTGWPTIGSDLEREPRFVRIDPATPGRPIVPGITPRGVAKIVHRLGVAAATRIRDAATKVNNPDQAHDLIVTAQRLDRLSPHILRHSLARRLLTQGAQLPEIQRILGHSRLSTTGMYLTPSEDDLREAINRIRL